MGADPFFLGGELPGGGPDGEATNAGWVEGSDWVIAEADESDASFLELRPEIAVVTNVELDHHSRWSSRAELFAAFREFAAPASGIVLGAGADLDAIPSEQTVVRFDADRARGRRFRSPSQASTIEPTRAAPWPRSSSPASASRASLRRRSRRFPGCSGDSSARARGTGQ